MEHPSPPEAVSLTIAVCTFNRATLLARMLGSIQHQTRHDFVVLVLDDCSSDGTRALCESQAGPRFRYVRNPTNLGFNANYNQALTLATTSHVLLTHDDDYMDRTFIDYLMKGVARYPEALLVTTNVRLMSEDHSPPPSALLPGLPPPPPPRLVDPSALRLTQDVVFKPGEYGEANYWKGLGLYCPTFCFHRHRCMEAQVAFDPVGPGSDVLISLRTNLAGPIAVLAEAHFNVCTHPGQDHVSVVNELTAGYRLDRVATPIVHREAVFASVRPVAQFNLVYHFAKAAIAAIIDLSNSSPLAPADTIERRYARHVDTLPPEFRDVVFACGRNRVAARLFGSEDLLAAVPRVAAADWIRSVAPLSVHQRKWHLLNYSVLDRLDDLLARNKLSPLTRPDYLRQRTILIWGFSYLGIILAEVLRQLDVPVAGFVDSNARLHGTCYRDLTCRSWPECFAACSASDQEILVFTGVEGPLDVELGFDVLLPDPATARCRFRSWRTAIDMIEAAGHTKHE